MLYGGTEYWHSWSGATGGSRPGLGLAPHGVAPNAPSLRRGCWRRSCATAARCRAWAACWRAAGGHRTRRRLGGLVPAHLHRPGVPRQDAAALPGVRRRRLLGSLSAARGIGLPHSRGGAGGSRRRSCATSPGSRRIWRSSERDADPAALRAALRSTAILAAPDRDRGSPGRAGPARGGASCEAPPLVSIVIPCYNQGALSRRGHRERARQSHPDVEVLVVDDGSTDDTPRSPDLEPFTTLARRSRHGGGPQSRLARRRGEFVVFLDADDRLLPDAVAEASPHSGRIPTGPFVTGHVRLIDETGTPVVVPPQDHAGGEYVALLRWNYIWTPGVVIYRRSRAGRRRWLRPVGRRLGRLRAEHPARATARRSPATIRSSSNTASTTPT